MSKEIRALACRCVLLIGCGYAFDAHATQAGNRTANAGPAGPDRPSANLAAISDQIRSWYATNELAGAEILVIKNGRTLLHESFGWRDRERQIPFERNTICRIGSLTKPVIGLCTLMLVEEGGLRIKDRVATHVPAFANPRSRDITVGQLLTHTSGLGDYPRGPADYENLEAMVRDIGLRGPEHAVGQRFHYSNAGAATLAYVITVVSGMAVEEFIRRRVIEPLGMRDTFCGVVPRAILPRVSCVYRREGDRFVKSWDNLSSPQATFFHGAGGIYSTTTDYARFLAAWMNRGRAGSHHFLSAETVRFALTPTLLNPRYACLWDVSEGPGEEALPEFGHGGWDGTRVWVVPSEDLMFLYFIQCGGRTPARIHSVVKDALRRSFPVRPGAPRE